MCFVHFVVTLFIEGAATEAMARKDDQKLAEGLACIREAEKCMKTSLFQWKPDLDGAADEYKKAAMAFKGAGATDQTRDCYMKAADAYLENKNLYHAGKCYEAAAYVFREQGDLDEAINLIEKAIALYREQGTADSAAQAYDKAGDVLAETRPEKAIDFYVQAYEAMSLEDRPKQCCDLLNKAIKVMIKHRKLEMAMGAIKKSQECYTSLDLLPQVFRLTVAAVLVQLALGDLIAAERAYGDSLNCPGFNDSDECKIVKVLLRAYDDCDQETADKVLNGLYVRHMENVYAQLARTIRVPGTIKKKELPTGEGANQGAAAEEDDEDEYAGGIC
ncbi:PREDICTED: gamma-soluble NSF attachment protein-like [Priapulus caudatus]|uniref:Gamma-soluble NSF attachment protein n=1 Tax=Priapulus caudatus TaxID=37621 RepID=A0ABM1EHS6_PRICU|nr:PREDICTED: gamma-soluble NSF attachment protein-like [Priapulus caudatus]